MKYAIVKGTQYFDSLWNMKKHFYTPSIHNIFLIQKLIQTYYIHQLVESSIPNFLLEQTLTSQPHKTFLNMSLAWTHGIGEISKNHLTYNVC